jgi:soluble lytic murein transglycosylase-like protein
MVFMFCNLSLEASPIAIWPFTKEQATEAGLDPHFVYSIAFAESTLDPFADSGKARGVMQLKKIAWNTVTDIPYAYAWDWQTNIKVGDRIPKLLQTNSHQRKKIQLSASRSIL